MACATEYRFEIADSVEKRRLPWIAMKAEGLERAVIWNRVEPAYLDWLDCVNPASALAGLVLDGGSLAGALWVNPVAGLCGCVHFVIFRGWHGDKVNLGKQAIRWLFDSFPLEAVFGMTPAVFRHVFPLIREWGFELSPLRLPKACHMPTANNPKRCCDAVISVLRKQDVR